ncbi:MAG: hypothetical protein GY846_14885 [Deltaproteobacteria bacterium]|nr:hypothetical protein [Deltaproteobacteria bacterium]
MSNDQDLYQEGIKSPKINSDPESNFDLLGSDEIIELTEVVNEGSDPLESDAGEPLLLDEEKPDHHPAEPTDDVTFEGMDPLSEVSEKAEGTNDPISEDPFSALESSDFKFEDSTPFGTVDTEELPEPSHERLDDVLADLQTEASALEKPEDILSDLEKDEPEDEETLMEQPDEFLSGYESPDEAEKPEDVPAGLEEKHKDYEKPEELADTHDIPGISEERMKALLTEVIQETIDRAVRKTFSEVAEKVIREAIEGLKQSIASSEEV